MRQFLAALLLGAGLAAYPGGAAYAEVAVPPLKSRVTDLTGTLNAQQKGELESRIAAFESRRGSRMAVLLLPTTKPEEIEQYSIRVAEAWKIGRKKIDDGLILIVAKDDRRLRIEVGYGLEGAIPDSVAKRVIDERITPRFREGDFYGGLRDGVDQLIRLAEGEKLPSPAAAPAATGIGPESVSFLRFFAGNPIFIVILTMIGGAILKGVLGRLPGSLATAAGIGLLVLLLYGIAMALIAAFAAFIVTFTNTGTGRSSGGWSSGGGSSGGGSWGGSSGGSSSSWGGGGGGFGGGGASGRW
jgi:uncharacterized protein